MVITQHKREVRITAFESNSNMVLAVCFYRINTSQNAFSGRLGIFTQMVVQRSDHIFNAQRFAVVKLNTTADLKRPNAGIRRCAPLFGKLGLKQSICSHHSQVIARLTKLNIDHIHVEYLTRIQRVSGCPTGHTNPQTPTFFRCGCCCHIRHAQSRWQSNARCQG